MTPEERATEAVDNLLRVGALGSADRRPEIEAELETFMDLVQPGWRDSVLERRLLPSMTVSHALAEASRPSEMPKRIKMIEKPLTKATECRNGDGVLSRAGAEAIATEPPAPPAPAVATVWPPLEPSRADPVR